VLEGGAEFGRADDRLPLHRLCGERASECCLNSLDCDLFCRLLLPLSHFPYLPFQVVSCQRDISCLLRLINATGGDVYTTRKVVTCHNPSLPPNSPYLLPGTWHSPAPTLLYPSRFTNTTIIVTPIICVFADVIMIATITAAAAAATITAAAAAATITTVIMRQGRALVQKSPVFLQQVATIARRLLIMSLRRCAASPVSPICYNFLMSFRPFQLVSLLQHSEDVMTVPSSPSPSIYDAHLLACFEQRCVTIPSTFHSQKHLNSWHYRRRIFQPRLSLFFNLVSLRCVTPAARFAICRSTRRGGLR
jgi:hypothetical protein